MQHGQALLAAGTIATISILTIAFHFYYIDGYGYGFFMSAFGYSLVAMAFAILVAAALSPSSWLYRLRIPGAYQIALWSYSLYLSHKAIGHILKEQLKPFALSPGMLLLAISVTSLLAGYVLYRLVEAPFMALRDKNFPSSFLPDQPTAAATAMAAKP
jgi:peptidoglycan/LPS O-acetylase OafA/YrhL